jgi:hypothetical protein
MFKKYPSLGGFFNNGFITMFYVCNKAEIEKRGLNAQWKEWES